MGIQVSCAVALVAAGLIMQSVPIASAQEAAEPGPRIALLTPHDGRSVNAPTLRVQALVAAFKPHKRKTFVFDGEEVPGRNTGRLDLVELSLDGVVIDEMQPGRCRKHLIACFDVDLTSLEPGPHTLTVAARQGKLSREASASFTIDPSLVTPERNLVEDAATPEPFACLALSASKKRVRLSGSLALGQRSDGFDLDQDRFVLAVGDSLMTVEPGSFVCKTKRKRRQCTFKDPDHPLVQSIKLLELKDGSWKIQVKGRDRPPVAETVFLRIGDDCGGVDLRTRAPLIDLRPQRDTDHAAESTIGVEGGTVQTTDATGAVITLDVPANALTQDTLIVINPLATAPLPGVASERHPGVTFEPSGLHFELPATLTLDFTSSSHAVQDGDAVFLVTSALTALPLRGTADPAAQTLTASLRHFSTTASGKPGNFFTDYKEWGDAVLSAAGQITVSELAALISVAEKQQQIGCTTLCIDLNTLLETVFGVYNNLIEAACTDALAAPSELSLKHLLLLEQRRIEDFLGRDLSLLKRECVEGTLRVLIDEAGVAASSGLEPDGSTVKPIALRLQRLKRLQTDAQLIVSEDLLQLASTYMSTALRKLLEQGREKCAEGDRDAAEIVFETARAFAHLTIAVDESLQDDLQAEIDGLDGDPTVITLLVGDMLPEFNRDETPANLAAVRVGRDSSNPFMYPDGNLEPFTHPNGCGTAGGVTMTPGFEDVHTVTGTNSTRGTESATAETTVMVAEDRKSFTIVFEGSATAETSNTVATGGSAAGGAEALAGFFRGDLALFALVLDVAGGCGSNAQLDISWRYRVEFSGTDGSADEGLGASGFWRANLDAYDLTSYPCMLENQSSFPFIAGTPRKQLFWDSTADPPLPASADITGSASIAIGTGRKQIGIVPDVFVRVQSSHSDLGASANASATVTCEFTISISKQ